MSLITVTSDNFTKEAAENSGTVLLDFWASWCGPCRMIAPIVDEIAEEREDITVGKVNVDEEQELAVKFGIVSIPTLIVLQGGEVVGKLVGVQSKETILDLLGD